MKLHLFYTILFCSLFSPRTNWGQDLEFTGKAEGFFDNGELKWQRFADEQGNYIGQWIDYFQPGIIKGKIDFDKGIAEVYHRNEQIVWKRISFCSNTLNRQGGFYEEWYKDGQKKYEGYWKGRTSLFRYGWITINIGYRNVEKINEWHKDGRIHADKQKWPNRTFKYDTVSTAPDTVLHTDLENLNGYYYYKDEGIPYSGIAELYHENGQQSLSVPIVNGRKQNKEAIFWWETGVQRIQVIIDEGEHRTIHRYPNGNYESVEDHIAKIKTNYFKNGQKRSLESTAIHPYVPYKMWDEEGNVLLNGEMKDGLKSGEWKSYAKNEQGVYFLQQIAHYEYGFLNGEVILYRNDGAISMVQSYQLGKLDGKWESYNEQGHLSLIAHYKNNQLDGGYIVHDEQGRVLYKLHYQEGVLHGFGLIMDEDETPLFEVQFWNDTLKRIKPRTEKPLFLLCGRVSHYTPWCGGMYGEGKSEYLSGKTILVREGKQNDDTKKLLKRAITIPGGWYFTYVKNGTYCLVDQRKMSRDIISSFSQTTGQFYKEGSESCYEIWFQSCDAVIKIEDEHKTDANLNYSSRCFVGDDPCMEYNGPYPP
jgi:antitoxin component YwqK of YwqJK toxin-antitoxin module